MAMVYHGVGQGITGYVDGREIGTDTEITLGGSTKERGTGQVVIGRRILQSGTKYVSTFVDEIKLYNRQLSEEEICKLN